MKLMPASRAAWITAIDSSWSGLPHWPNIMAPRHRRLTCTPVRPNARYLIVASSARRPRVTPGPVHPTLQNAQDRVDGSRHRGEGGGGRAVSLADLVADRPGAGALRERVGHRVLTEQEVQDRCALHLDRLDGRRGLDAGRVL